jgi:hypothetical protein
MVIMEDLGDGPSLAGALQGDDPLAAELALVAYAEALGRMHAATIGIEPDRYRSVTWDLTSLVAAGEKVRGALASVDVTPPPGVDADLAEVDALLSDPSFRCLTHGDPCPDNTRLRDGRLLLFDFEDAGTRHAVLDCVFLHLPFPSCWCWAQIPEAVVHKARDAHRATLAPACPAILDDGVYLRAIAAAAAAWVVVHLQYSLPGAIEADRSWGLATTRLRLVTWLDVLAATTAEAAAFPALHTLAVDLAARLRHLWPDLPPVDPYPPFRP